MIKEKRIQENEPAEELKSLFRKIGVEEMRLVTVEYVDESGKQHKIEGILKPTTSAKEAYTKIHEIFDNKFSSIASSVTILNEYRLGYRLLE